MKIQFSKSVLIGVLVGLIGIPLHITRASIPDRQRHIDVTGIEPTMPNNQHIINQKLLATYIPLDLTPTSDETAFAIQLQRGIQQRAADEFFSGRMFDDSTIGRISAAVENATKTDMTFGKTLSGEPAHKINLDVRAFEQKARLKYEGTFTSSFTYAADTNSMELRISRPLSRDTTLEFVSTNGSDSRFTVTYSF